MNKVKLKDISVNLDKRRKPLNGLDREKISNKKLYPYCGANNIMDYVDEYLFDEEVLCIAEDGGKWGKNETCSYIMKEKCWINNHAHVIKVNDNVDIRYLKYWFDYTDLNPFITGAIIRKLTQKALNELEIDLPEKSIQINVSNTIEKVIKLIDKNKEREKLLDDLVNSKFIEMFGNPNNNDKNWKECKVIDVCECMVPGRDKPKSFTGQTPWITIEDLEVNSTTYESKSKLGLTDDEINEVKRKKIPIGSVIMSCVGNLGICSIAGTEMIINQQLHSFQCKDDINNIFLMYILGKRKWYMEKNASSTTVLYMNKTVCNSIPIFVPPIELQNEFADYVRNINNGKKYIQNNIEELKNLQNSLMNKYFN